MNHSPSPPEEPNLFDLPLQGPTESEEEPPVASPEAPAPESPRQSRRAARRATANTLPLFQAPAAVPELELDALQPAPPPDPPLDLDDELPPGNPGPRFVPAAHRPRLVEAVPEEKLAFPANLVARFKAATADLVVFAAVAALQLVGTARFGITLRWADWPAYAAFLLAFSYLYSVISLAFWGQTPGMVWAGILARSRDAEPLAFGQTSRRWLGGLLTLALAGLPGLFALSGRSLADWMSGSRTVAIEERAA